MIISLPSSRVSHNDTVIDGEGISGQTKDVPSLNFDWFTQTLAQ